MQSGIVTGGLGSAKEANPKISEIVQKIKPALESKSGKTFESLEPLSYKTQVVAGTNYFVKVSF